ncbi:MAG: hypothetical protein KatS3mg126_0070 [Lysobacteraceae bacterium]|nr:MAG: hypothetical protein KatS3mg082_3258 [Nitrospiraceae bacterium]GIX34291.1 MAG: hypothetical protein KatS3mg126_0070 [Xanthomonadaceae bacterium]
MSDRASIAAGGRGPSVGEALRALPLESPPREVWPEVRRRLGPAPRPRRGQGLGWLAALAAVLALAVLLPWRSGEQPGPAPAGGQRDLVALMRESARLEKLIAAAQADPLQSGDSLLLGLALEAQIAAVDAALAEPVDADRREALWQQRVELLSDYAELQLARRSAAAEGTSFRTTLVSLY